MAGIRLKMVLNIRMHKPPNFTIILQGHDLEINIVDFSFCFTRAMIMRRQNELHGGSNAI